MSSLNNEENPGIAAYDPLLQALNNELAARQQSLFAKYYQGHKIRRFLYFNTLRLRNNWIGFILFLTSAIFILLSVALFYSSWPWSDKKDAVNDSSVVLACATILTLGVVLLSSLSDPMQKAADVGAGFTTALLRRPGPWIVGVLVAPITVFLAWLATKRPDAESAQASALLVAGMYSLFWALSRNLIELSDSLKLGKVLAKHAHKSTRGMAKSAEWLPKFILRRDTPKIMLDEFVAIERRDLVTGSIRNTVAASRRCLQIGRSYEAYELWIVAIEEIKNLAIINSGAVGQTGGVGDIIRDSLPFVSRELQNQGDSNAAAIVISKSAELISLPHDHPDCGYVRMSINGALQLLLAEEWREPKSILPSVVVGAQAAQVKALVDIRAFEDSNIIVQGLFQVLSKACADEMLHIEEESSKAIVASFISFVKISEPMFRNYLLGNWARSATTLTLPSILKQNRILLNPGHRFLPGISLQSQDLQGVIVSIRTQDEFDSVARCLVSYLLKLFPSISDDDTNRYVTERRASDVLALILAMLYQRKSLTLEESSGECNGQWFMANVITLVNAIPQENRSALLKNSDFVDLLWSCLLSAGATDDSPDVVIQNSTTIASWLDLINRVNDQFVLRFMRGVLLASGKTREEVEGATHELEGANDFFLANIGINLEPMGIVNRCNRNRTKHRAMVPDAIEAWAMKKFPSFV